LKPFFTRNLSENREPEAKLLSTESSCNNRFFSLMKQKVGKKDGFVDNLHSNYECTSYWLCELQDAEQEKQKL
jgi:hypothetical protein